MRLLHDTGLMISIPFFAGEALFTVIWVLIRTCICAKKGLDIKREILMILMYINLAVLLRVTFFPMEKINGRVQPLLFEPDKITPLRVNLVPLVHILEYKNRKDVLMNIIGNVTMFIPSGIILPILYRKLDSFVKVTAAGAAMSLCIEIMQLPFAVRASDIDDLILNTLGVMIGYIIYAAVYGVIKTLRNGRSYDRDKIHG